MQQFDGSAGHNRLIAGCCRYKISHGIRFKYDQDLQRHNEKPGQSLRMEVGVMQM